MECMYKFVNQCKCNADPSAKLVVISKRSIETSRTKSIIRDDSLFSILEQNKILIFSGHDYCRKQYNSKDHTDRFVRECKKRKSIIDESCPTPEKTVRLRSGDSDFDIEADCFYCGLKCFVENPDPKNPGRWNEGVLCTTADRGKGKKSYLWVVLEV